MFFHFGLDSRNIFTVSFYDVKNTGVITTELVQRKAQNRKQKRVK